MKKKGEVTTQQLVMIIILIASFAVILFFLMRLNLQSTSDKEICHNSVVLKSKTADLVGKLDCKTNYICISGGEKCEDISASETIDINLNSENAEEQIMKAIAEEMADCWWMFGEGEVQYLSAGEQRVESSVCGLCSIVKFDEKIIEQTESITYREFYEYLSELEKDEGETYFTYLYDVFDIKIFLENSPLKIDIDNSLLISEDKYAIVTGHEKTWIFKNHYMPPHYLKVSQLSSELNCVDYVTKA